jgi:hypothetical protein
VSSVSRLLRRAVSAPSALMNDGSMDLVKRKRFHAGRKGSPKQCRCRCGTDANGRRWKPNLNTPTY